MFRRSSCRKIRIRFHSRETSRRAARRKKGNLVAGMSATPNNAGAAWSTPPSGPPEADLGESSGRDALQALLAFACIHEQAARRKGKDSTKTLITKEEEFALDEVLRLVAARAISITGADGVAIAIAEESAIVCRASVGRIAPPPGVRLDPNSGFSGAGMRSSTNTLTRAQSSTPASWASLVCLGPNGLPRARTNSS